MSHFEIKVARGDARARAQAAATPGDWLSTLLSHHVQIESAFSAVKNASNVATQMKSQSHLVEILTGHSNAEESVIYPALIGVNEKAHATKAYAEQAATKTQMGLLERLVPMTQDYFDELEQIRDAVAHHMFEEEGTWFLELKARTPLADQSHLTQRYREEFARYCSGAGADAIGDSRFVPSVST